MGILIARHLGPEHYGRFGAALGLATLAKEAVMLGFDRLIRRDFVARPADSGRILGTSIGLGLMMAFVVVVSLTALSRHVIDDLETRQLALIVIWMALPQAFFACEIWFESAGRTGPLVWTRNVVWLCSLAGRVGLILTDADVFAFAILALAEWAATYAAVVLLLRTQVSAELALAFDGSQFRAWFREGWPATAMVVIGSTADRIMVLLVNNFSDTAQAGYLSAAVRITEVWWSISSIIAAVLLPRIVSLRKTEPERAEGAIQLYANASLLVAFCAALGVTFTAPWLVPLLFGSAYAPSGWVMVVLFWGGPAVFASIARSQMWVSQARLGLELPSVVAIALTQLGLAGLLIPTYGAMGAAWSLTLGNWIGFHATMALIPQLRACSAPQWHAWSALLRPWQTVAELRRFIRNMIGR